MTRSSTKELFTPFKKPEQVFHSKRKLFKTTSLDYSTSLKFDLFSDPEDQSGIARLKINDKAHFELKGQFLKELLFPMSLTEAASRWLRNELTGSIDTWETLKKRLLSKYYLPSRTAKKMEEINNFQQEPDETLYQAWERFKEQLLRCVIPSMKAVDAKKAIQDMADHSQKWHNGTSTRTRSTNTSDGLAAIQVQLNNLGREIKKINERVYAAQVGLPFPQGGRYRVVAPGFYQRENGNPSHQEQGQTMEESLNKFMAESAKLHDENLNLIKEIRALTDAAIRNQGASTKALEIQIGQMSKVLQERGSGSLPSSTETNPRDHVKSISTTVEADTP
ncbi:zf-CCHC domain-containing protein [Tanacetum coccineum]